jgi:hypothetical protein
VWFLVFFLHFFSPMDPIGMTQSPLRAKIRELSASGALPPGLPQVGKTIPGQTIRLTRIVIGRVAQGTCLICGELDPMVTYMYSGGKVLRLHAACDTLWQRECATP